MAKKKRATARRYSTRDKLLTLSQEKTQSQIAKMLGVSSRTIRRWKSERVEPDQDSARIRRALRKLQSSFEREHKRIAQEQRRESRKRPGAPRLERRVKVLPPAARRQLKVYRRGRDTGKTRASEWLNYDVAKLGLREIFDLVKALRDDDRVIQLIYRIPKGARYPRDARGRPGRVVKESTRSASPPLDLSNLDDSGLMDFLLTYVDPQPTPKSRRIIFVSALDKKRRQ